MLRRQLLPCAPLIIALGLAVVAVPLAAWGQEGSTEERIDRLERDLNMLQRQVYRGAPPPAPGAAGNGAVDAEIRMERLEQQMRELTGRVEDVSNQLQRLHQRIEQVNGDIDMRLGRSATAATPDAGPPAMPAGRPHRAELGGPPPAGDLPFPPAATADGDEELAPPRTAAAPPGAGPGIGPPGVGASGVGASGPVPIFGTLTPPGAAPRPAPPASAAAAAPPPRAPAGGPLPDGSPTEQYNYAFGLLKKANYPAAEAALKAFVERHPGDRLAGSAQYWLGETYYTRGRYADAASAFAEGYKRYPKSPKAADDLLKLAMALAHANQKQNACLALGQLDHDFPHAGSAVKDHAAAEKKRLGC